MSEQKPQQQVQQKQVEQKQNEKPQQQKREHRCIIVKGAKLEEVQAKIAGRVPIQQDGEDVVIYDSSYKYRNALEKEFGKEKVEIKASEYQKFISASNAQGKIAFAKFCRENTDLNDDSEILMIIRSSPREAILERAENFVKDIVKICYADSEKKCKFFVRGWLLRALQTLTKAGITDKNGKQTDKCRVFKRQDAWEKNVPAKRSIECRVFVKKSEVQEILKKLEEQKMQYVRCTYSNPAKFAERRKERRQDKKVQKQRQIRQNKQRKQKQDQDQVKIEVQTAKKLTIFTESEAVAQKLNETFKGKEFQLRIEKNKLIAEQDVAKVHELAKQIKLNGKKLNMKLE